jgi:hypothetical protein
MAGVPMAGKTRIHVASLTVKTPTPSGEQSAQAQRIGVDALKWRQTKLSADCVHRQPS